MVAMHCPLQHNPARSGLQPCLRAAAYSRAPARDARPGAAGALRWLRRPVSTSRGPSSSPAGVISPNPCARHLSSCSVLRHALRVCT